MTSVYKEQSKSRSGVVRAMNRKFVMHGNRPFNIQCTFFIEAIVCRPVNVHAVCWMVEDVVLRYP